MTSHSWARMVYFTPWPVCTSVMSHCTGWCQNATILEKRLQVWGNLIFILVHRLKIYRSINLKDLYIFPKLQLSQFHWNESGQGDLIWKWSFSWVQVPRTRGWRSPIVNGRTLMMTTTDLCQLEMFYITDHSHQALKLHQALSVGKTKFLIRRRVRNDTQISWSGDTHTYVLTNAFCLHICIQLLGKQ